MKKIFLINIIIVIMITMISCQQQKSSDNQTTEEKELTNSNKSGQNDTQNKSKAPINITSPANNDTVPQRPYIQGTVSDTSFKVWVIVHPILVAEYWVQPKIMVRENGIWKCSIYIGREGNVDVGKRFEVMAVADPKEELSEGMMLSFWPTSKAKSEIIELVRK
jgi:hypothetical protein